MTSVEEYANWRGISPQRVRELLRNGSIPGHRIGRQWLVDQAAFAQRSHPGRPMSPPMAWALISALGGDQPVDNLSPIQWSRLRKYRDRLAHSECPAALLSSWLRQRGERLVYRAADADVNDLGNDPRLMPSGISDPRAGISSGDSVEVWLRDVMSLDGVVSDYLLLPDQKGQVVIHRGREHREPQPPLGLVIADLADWNGPREDGRVAELLAAR